MDTVAEQLSGEGGGSFTYRCRDHTARSRNGNGQQVELGNSTELGLRWHIRVLSEFKIILVPPYLTSEAISKIQGTEMLFLESALVFRNMWQQQRRRPRVGEIWGRHVGESGDVCRGLDVGWK